VASVHSPVLVSRFAPKILSSSGAEASEVGAEASEAQPDTNQATPTKLMMDFMGMSCTVKVDNAQSCNAASVSSADCAPISGFGNPVTVVI
jgi:hypothetical protein